MRRRLVVGVVGVQTAVLLLAAARPALAHATFPGQGPLTAQADQTLNMAVPEERDPDTHNVGVKVEVPPSWGAVGCKATAPWHCTISGAVIQWTKDAGAPPGPDDVAFAFTVHTGGPGDYPIPVVQQYSSGEEVHWAGPPSSGEPAPVLTVSAPASSPSPPPSAAPAATAPAPSPSKPAAAPAPATPHPTASTAHPAATASSPPPSAAPTAPPTPPTPTKTASASPSSTTTVISAPDDHGGKKASGSGSVPLIIGVIPVVALLGTGLAVLRRRHARG